jgi:hypothetical protein
LFVYLVEFDPETVPLNAVLVTRLLGIRELESQIADLVVSLVKCALVFETDAVEDLLVSLLSLLALLLDSVLETLNLAEVLSLLEEHLISFLVGFLNLFLALLGQDLHSTFLLFIESNLLLLVLKELD